MKKLIALSLVLLSLCSAFIFPAIATAEIVERPPTATPAPTAAPTPSPYRTWNALSAEEQKQTERIKYINNRLFYYEPQISACMVSFSFKDKDERYLAAPAIVTIRIENKKGQIVYEKTQEITMDDFDKYTSNYRWDEGEYFLAEIPVFINAKNIEDLKVYLYVEQYNGYYFKDTEIQNNYLKLSLPKVPYTLRTAYHGAEISKFNYCYTSGGYLHVYMTGVMKLSTKSYFSPQFALLDSEGYQVATSNGANNYSTGTKFKDFDMSFGKVDPGSYSFK